MQTCFCTGSLRVVHTELGRLKQTLVIILMELMISMGMILIKLIIMMVMILIKLIIMMGMILIKLIIMMGMIFDKVDGDDGDGSLSLLSWSG